MSPLPSPIPHRDEGCFCSLGHFNNFGDFQSVHLAHAAAMDAEILGETVHSASFNRSLTCHDTVTKCLVKEHVVVVGSVGDEGINFQKRPLVEKQTNAVPRRAPSARSNGFLALEASSKASVFSLGAKLF
jgi:hypothetical protein